MSPIDGFLILSMAMVWSFAKSPPGPSRNGFLTSLKRSPKKDTSRKLFGHVTAAFSGENPANLCVFTSFYGLVMVVLLPGVMIFNDVTIDYGLPNTLR